MISGIEKDVHVKAKSMRQPSDVQPTFCTQPRATEAPGGEMRDKSNEYTCVWVIAYDNSEAIQEAKVSCGTCISWRDKIRYV
jgi:hypothetical protein